MPEEHHENGPAPATEVEPSGCLTRLAWMVGANLIIAITAMAIAREPMWSFGLHDFVFWGIVAVGLAARYVDVSRLDGRTANGEPATMAHFRRYSLGLIVISGFLWSAAHSIEI